MFFVVVDGAINNMKKNSKRYSKTAKHKTNTMKLFHPLIIVNIKSHNQFINTESEV
jgi:hypothetical protein